MRSRTCSSSRTGRSTSTSTRRRRSTPRSTQFTKKTGIKVNYIEDINDNATFFGKIQGAAQPRPEDRPRHHRDDGQLALPGAARRKGLGREARQEADAEHQEPEASQQHPAWDPNREYSAAMAVRHDGHRLEREADEAGHDRSTSCSTDKKLQGQGDDARSEFADTVGLIMLANGDNPGKVDRRIVRQGARGSRRRSSRARSASSPATTTRACSPRATSSRRSSGRGTWSRLLADNTNLSSADSQGRRHDLDRQHADPEGRRRAHRVDLHGLRLRPEDRGPDRASVNYICPSRVRTRCSLKTDPETAKNPLIFPTAAMLAQVHQFDSEALLNDDCKAKWQKCSAPDHPCR